MKTSLLIHIPQTSAAPAASTALATGLYVAEAQSRPQTLHVEVTRRRHANGLMLAAIRRYRENEGLVD